MGGTAVPREAGLRKQVCGQEGLATAPLGVHAARVPRSSALEQDKMVIVFFPLVCVKILFVSWQVIIFFFLETN